MHICIIICMSALFSIQLFQFRNHRSLIVYTSLGLLFEIFTITWMKALLIIWCFLCSGSIAISLYILLCVHSWIFALSCAWTVILSFVLVSLMFASSCTFLSVLSDFFHLDEFLFVGLFVCQWRYFFSFYIISLCSYFPWTYWWKIWSGSFIFSLVETISLIVYICPVCRLSFCLLDLCHT